MNFIRSTAGVPAYLQLYEALRSDIIEGIYPYGTKLPSKRTLSTDTGLSLVTVEHALNLLEDEGYIESRERRGSFVVYRQEDIYSAPRMTASVHPPRLSRSDAPFPYSVLARTMRRVISEYRDEIMERSPGKGIPELREAISRYLARSRSLNVNPEQIIIGAGAEYLYGLLIILLGRTRIYGIEDPVYDPIQNIYRSHDISTELLRMGDNGILTSELMRTSASVLHVTPYHSYPSGISTDSSKRREYIRWALERRANIIEDDFASELSITTKPQETLYSLEPKHTVIYMNTFSVTIAPSFRTGYIILPEDLLSTYEEKAGFYSCTVPAFIQYVLTELINSGDFERHINRTRRKMRQTT
ncbi:MAG: PLP-dependent aminotransferase family protein [Solobacterium sp.]|nr:PLP-dependent aminotransferase family protein [Solobacterium sp.]